MSFRREYRVTCPLEGKRGRVQGKGRENSKDDLY